MTEIDKPFLPYGRQTIDDDDVAAVVSVLRGDWLTAGPTVQQFEAAFAARVGARHAVSCSSGTAGLHLAVLALGFGPEDVVIVPSMTFLATANAARYVGAEVVFADVDANNGLLNSEHLDAAIARSENRPRALMPVHLNGQTVDMRALSSIAKEHDLRVIEDACHALGTVVRGEDGSLQPVGSCAQSDMAVFSLHPVKTATMGEGGVVTTNDAKLYERLLRMRNHGMVRQPDDQDHSEAPLPTDGSERPWYYEMPEIGFNYRASDLHCALGLSQLSKLERFATKRHELVARYIDRLSSLSPTVQTIDHVDACEAAWHLCPVLIDFETAETTRSRVMDHLRSDGIGTQVHYVPVHHQPYYRNRYGEINLPGADAYYARVLSLPLFPTMDFNDVDRVVQALAGAIANGSA